MRLPSPGGVAGAGVAAGPALLLEPLLPLDPAVHGLAVGIVAAHGYLVGALVARGPRRRAGLAVAAGWATAVLGVGAVHATGPTGATTLAETALAVAAVLVGCARGLRAAGQALARAVRAAARPGALRMPAWPVGLAAALCLLPVPGPLPPPAPGPDPAGPASVQIYVRLADAPTVVGRTRLAVAALDRAGAFRGRAVLVVVPTGSGWVKPAAVRALSGPGVATVAVQYAGRPSWQEYLLDPDAARASATALAAALRRRLDLLPAEARPRLVVYGESLGARGVAGTAGFADAVVAAGTPAGVWSPPLPGVTAVCHADDPVCWFAPRLLVSRPAGWAGPWLPVVSFWLTAAGLLHAVDAPPGQGHRYGPEVAGWPQARAA